MRTTWMAAAMAVVGLAGCDGGGGGHEKRTYLACGDQDACLVMQSDVPSEMNCSAPEVEACATDGVLGTCQVDDFVFHMTMYVYADDMLAEGEADCLGQGGTWTLAAAP